MNGATSIEGDVLVKGDSSTEDLKLSPADEDALKQVCADNGISFHKLNKGSGEDVKNLEVFFNAFPNLFLLKHFSNITHLYLIACDVHSIQGLQYLQSLRELFVIENHVKTIGFLENCTELQKLYLYDNKISKIEGIGCLKNLEVLWLNSNEILEIEGLEGLKKLKDLNLADNLISSVGQSLHHSSSLESLDLSGNKVSSFKDLTHLARLGHLKSLSLKDPCSTPNPVCLLCNCTTHLLYHMPQLTRLDTQDVTLESVQEVESIVLKKKMYYNMRVKTVYRNMSDLVTRLDAEKKKTQAIPVARLNALHQLVKKIELEIESDGGCPEDWHNSHATSDGCIMTENTQFDPDLKVAREKLEAQLVIVRDRIIKWQKRLKLLDNNYTEFLVRIKQVADASVLRLTTELETGGNVRFEDGVATDVWYSSCRDLVMSRFCTSMLRQFDITGMKINRITRLHNRMLRLRFDEKLDSSVDDTPAKTSSQFKKKLEYLFYTWSPQAHGSCNEVIPLLENGMSPGYFFKKKGLPFAAVPLSNSVSLADISRLKYITKNSIKRTGENEDAKHGQLIVCKVYLGRTVLATDNSNIDTETYPNADSVFLPVRTSATDTTDSKSSNDQENIGCIKSKDNISSSHDCDCNTRQCDWYIFDHEMVVPEYVVDFQYTFRNGTTSSPFTYLSDGLAPIAPSTVGKQAVSEEDDDSDLMNSITFTSKKRLRFVTINDEILSKVTNGANPNTLTSLNLYGCGLTRGKQLSNLPNLKRLVLAFNELTRLEDFGKVTSLEYLDVSFNKLNTLEGLRNVNKIRWMDLSWNELCNSRDDVAILRKHAPNIITLNMEHNPWRKLDGLRLRVIGRLKLLKNLNGFPITDQENSAALRAAASARVSPASLLSNARIDLHRPRSLSLAPYAEIIFLNSKRKPEKSSEVDSTWFLKITCLFLDGQHLSKLSNLERLENLKYASFRNNDITKIEGLEYCVQLEELSLDNNSIAKLEGISKLSRLKRLSVPNNVISAIESNCMESLESLYYLSLESNRLTSLSALQKCTSVMELYVGNNEISNNRELFNLKNFTNLVILDLCGNPIATETTNYRLFVVYHLKPLKALDGAAISQSDINHARDYFGGKLTLDFVADKLRLSDFTDVKEMDFPNCAIRFVDLGQSNFFSNLRSLNLEHNSLTSLSGLVYLENLQVLCLNYNKVDCMLERPKHSKSGGNVHESHASFQSFNRGSVLPRLEVLHLGYNGITDMNALHLSCVSNLKSLFLQGNEITDIDGLHALEGLRDLVLDRNKIKNIDSGSFVNNNNLVELHLEENRIPELSSINMLQSLQRLYLANNRIQDMAELDRLEALSRLVELNITNNAISRRLLHRPVLVFRQPNLEIIDGVPVTEEERQKADMYFVEQQPPAPMVSNQIMENSLPGIKSVSPIKLTSVQLGNGTGGGHFGLDDGQGPGGLRNNRQPRHPANQAISGINHRSSGGGIAAQAGGLALNLPGNARLYKRFFQSPPK